MGDGDSDGIRRLTAYLNQTRRQATQSIDVLTGRVKELEQNLETSALVAERLEAERDYFKGISEQLKVENSKKWRLHERDDWRSLVESVQLDRERLQEENAAMEEELESLRLAGGAGGRSGGGEAAENELVVARERIKQLENSLRLVSPDKGGGKAAGGGEGPRPILIGEAMDESKRGASADEEDDDEQDQDVEEVLMQAHSSDSGGGRGWGFFGFGGRKAKKANPVIIV